ncbi:MAG: zinc ribbon domain-containing protein, partial [Ktedonobacteraceae bacterium]
GVHVAFVDARYTSQACSRCGYIAKRNRVCQSEFSCQSCGYQCNADLNAAYNLASRAKCVASGLEVKQPIVPDLRV